MYERPECLMTFFFGIYYAFPAPQDQILTLSFNVIDNKQDFRDVFVVTKLSH